MTRTPIRIEHDGHVYAGDRVVLVLFFREAHERIGPALLDVVDRYMQHVGEDAFEWIGGKLITASHQVLYSPIDDKLLQRVRRRLRNAAKHPDEWFVIRDGVDDQDLPAHRIWYRCGEQPMPTHAVGTATSALEVWFPSEPFVDPATSDRAGGLLRDIAAALPFCSGYASLALASEKIVDPAGFAAFVDGFVFSHPGLDLPNTEALARVIGERIRGVYWQTFVSTLVLDRVQCSVEQLDRQLPDGVELHPFSEGRCAMQAGSHPTLGDVPAGDDLPALRALARLLWPACFVQTRGFPGGLDGVDDWIRWQLRHLLPAPAR